MSHVPTVLVPGLLCSPRLYAEQLPALWRSGPVSVASIHHDDSMAAIARRFLAAAPPQFALAGLSMGGYLAFEIMRQAGHRVTRLALLNTSARPDTAEQAQSRRDQVAMTQDGQFTEVVDILYRRWVRAARRGDLALHRVIRQMASETGPEAFIRQQTAIVSLARLAGRPRRDRLPGACRGRGRRRHHHPGPCRRDRRTHPWGAAGRGTRLRPPVHAGAAGRGHPGASRLANPVASSPSAADRMDNSKKRLAAAGENRRSRARLAPSTWWAPSRTRCRCRRTCG